MSKQIKYKYIIILTLLIVANIPVKAGVIVQDATGRTISLNETPSKIVSLSPSITEILAYLGELDRVVGADSISLSDTWFNVSSILKTRGVIDVGGYWWSTVKAEEILRINPDIVFADKGAHVPLLDFFKNYNITVVYLAGGSSKSIQDVLSDFYTIATLLNKTSLADDFAIKLESELGKYRDLITSKYKGVKVLIIVDLTSGIWVAGKGTYIDDILERLGLSNACSNIYSWSSISLEKVIELNPDIIVVTYIGPNSNTLKESGLTNLGKPIIVLNQTETDIISRPGPLIIYAPQVIYNVLTRSNITRVTGSEEPSTYSVMVIIILVALVALITIVLAKRYWRK